MSAYATTSMLQLTHSAYIVSYRKKMGGKGASRLLCY
jgi:hypothetical protein